MEGFGIARLVLSLLVLGGVVSFVAVRHHMRQKWEQGKIMKQHLREEMEKAHECHHSCGADAACHSKCPRPWEPFLKACHDLPEIKKCRATCKGAECGACPKFDIEWINKKFDANPERAAEKGEQKCQKLEKAHSCHQHCKLGDHECHHSCPPMFDFHHKGYHHGDHEWHHYDHYHDDQDMNLKKIFREVMEKTHSCHHSCGADAACHSKCPRPWEPFLKACHDLPEIKKCRATCKNAECEACPKFDIDWINKIFDANPELVVAKREEKCHELEKVHACHQACKLGDHECHHSCPSMFDFHHKGYHHGDHHDHHHDHNHHGHHHDHHHGHHHDHDHNAWHHHGHHDADVWHKEHTGNDQHFPMAKKLPEPSIVV